VLLAGGELLVVAGYNGAPPLESPDEPEFDHHSLNEELGFVEE